MVNRVEAMAVHQIKGIREGDGEGGEIGGGDTGADGDFGGDLDVDLVPKTGRKDVVQERGAALDHDGVDIAGGKVGENEGPVGAIAIDDGGFGRIAELPFFVGFIGENAGIGGDDAVAVYGDTDGVSALPMGVQQTRIIEEDCTRADHDRHVFCAHLMDEGFRLNG